MCNATDRWSENPRFLIGICVVWREDLKATAASLVYGQALRLPGEFLIAR